MAPSETRDNSATNDYDADVDADESCEIVIELTPTESVNNNRGNEDVLEMNTRFKIPKSNNQFVTIALLFLVAVSSFFTLLKNVYFDNDSSTYATEQLTSHLGEGNYTMINDTIKTFYIH